MKSVLITGGTGGLGSAVVPRLAREYRCVLAYRSKDAFEKLRHDMESGSPDPPPAAVPAAGNDRPTEKYTSIEGIPALADAARFAPLHGIVLLAGAFAAGATSDDYARMFDANVNSVAAALEAALPLLSAGGRVVAISSAATLTHPGGLAAYTASKAAVNAIIRTAANELAPRKGTANALLPTALDTPAMRGNMKREQLVPLERVAEWIAFLLSEAGASVSGQLIELRP